MWEPRSFDDVIGNQAAVASVKSLIQKASRGKRIMPILLYGPPGTGKSTIASLASSSLVSILARGDNVARSHKPHTVTINASMDRSPIKLSAKLFVPHKGPQVFQLEEIDSMPRESQLTLSELIATSPPALVIMTCNVIDAVDPLLRDVSTCLYINGATEDDMVRFVRDFGIHDDLVTVICKEASGDVRRAVMLATTAQDIQDRFGVAATKAILQGPCSSASWTSCEEPIDVLSRSVLSHVQAGKPASRASEAVVRAMRSVTVSKAFVREFEREM